MSQMDESASHFLTFKNVLKTAIAKYGHIVASVGEKPTRQQREAAEAAFIAIQKRQIEELADLEERFRLALVRDRRGPSVYSAFAHHITRVRGNILAARPYFRERQEVFTTQIARALQARNPPRLYGCRINYQFVNFAMRLMANHPCPWSGTPSYDSAFALLDARGATVAEYTKPDDAVTAAIAALPWPAGGTPAKLAKRIAEARWELVVLNMPLAISRARAFYGKTPKSHLSFMDLVQHAAEGLISAIDKFELPYTEVFKGVACGWMTGNFIEAYSETMIHFYPKDKRRIYRANKYRSKFPHGGYEVQDLVAAVNEGMEDDSAKTTPDEIQDLMAAASTVSSDTKAPGEAEDVPDNVARYEAPEESRPDVQVEALEARAQMIRAANTLPHHKRKTLWLSGIPVDISP
jgi:RNA polymerase sigma factor (sigma-70 family)